MKQRPKITYRQLLQHGAVTTAALVLPTGVLSARKQTMKQPAFYPGKVWQDADGKPIESHLGGVFYVDDLLLVWQ